MVGEYVCTEGCSSYYNKNHNYQLIKMLLLSFGLYRLRNKALLIVGVRRVYYQLIKAVNLIKWDIQRETVKKEAENEDEK